MRTSNRSLTVPNKVILQYTKLQKQESFYINCAHMLYNKLPNEIKKCEQYSTVVNWFRKYFIDKTIARALIMS